MLYHKPEIKNKNKKRRKGGDKSSFVFRKTQQKREEEKHLDSDEMITLLQEDDHAHCENCNSEVTVANQWEDPSSGMIADCRSDS